MEGKDNNLPPIRQYYTVWSQPQDAWLAVKLPGSPLPEACSSFNTGQITGKFSVSYLGGWVGVRISKG